MAPAPRPRRSEVLPTRLTRRVAAVAAAVVLVAGCGSTGSGDAAAPAASGSAASAGTPLTVFAAASLTETFTTLGTTFEAAHPGTKVTFNFGSSATLAQQITQGAPADVFAAASPATMKSVTDAGLAAGTPATFVRNRLEIAVPPGNPAKVDELRDLADPKVKVALCAAQVPCGAAAVKALDAAGLKVTPVTLEQDVKATLTKVELGEVDAALVYRTDVLAAGGKVKGIDFPEAAEAINDYPVAALSKAAQPELARQFVDLVLSPQGRDVLTAAGFESP
ncbi:molybdate ABC transporter substrate-binding protein [Microbispora sp. ATCC PTA-5024]|uniref:molybdate ABC transporter substrate-binding protein n=1 Tax=Microbispora sp. ATCC PTA-5024 TaxID=316330 RepID=UPI000A07058C